VLARQGEFAEAEELITHALRTSESRLGAKHPDVASAAYRLAQVKRHQGKLTEAEAQG
jgi:hypothetical protein